MSAHAERAHALLSASGAERWIHCPPSAKLEAGLPDSTSEHAATGTLAHEMAELRLRKQYTEPGMTTRSYNAALKKLKESPLYQPEMDGHIETYADIVAGIVHKYGSPPHIAIERRLDFSHVVPDGFGTGDCVVIGGGEMNVVDFKYGKGVEVSAERNSQMMLYALGALRMYGLLYHIEQVALSIVQPRVSAEAKIWFTTPAELEAWAESVRPAAQMAHAGAGEYRAGDWCRFCRARATCRARADHYLALEGFQKALPPMLGNDEVGDIMRRARGLLAWAQSVDDYALAELLAGREIPGWKAVEGRSNRAFVDQDAAFAALIGAGVDEALLYKRSPVTLTEAEKLLDKNTRETVLAQYIIKPKGKPALAEESDKREPYRPTSAAEDFGPIPA